MDSYYYLSRKLNREKFFKKSKFNFKSFVKIVGICLIFLVFLSVVTLSIFSTGVLAEYQNYFSEPKMLSYNVNNLTIFDRNGDVLYRTPGRYNTQLIPLKDISPNLVKATLATEDKDFYKHNGFSIKSIARALLTDVKNQDLYKQGGSTITQQLSRTFFLNNDKSLVRKVKELVLATEIERRYSKNQILDFYLNNVYYGSGAYGAPEASRVYFNKDVKDLTLSESSLLAALPSAPTELSLISGDKERAFQRQAYILNTLAKKGDYSPKEIETAKVEKPTINTAEPVYADAPHFSVMVKNQLKALFPNIDINNSGLRVYTTIDKKLQNKAEDLVKERVKALAGKNVTNGAFLSTNPQTGEILALVGSVDFSQPQWGSVNVLTSPRSPGSSIKPLVYASAIDSKAIATTTVLHDEKTTYKNEWETYTPVDSDGKTRGIVSPRIALANSLNIPAVEVISKNGLARTLQTVNHLGVTGLKQPTDYGLSFVLGGEEVKGLDMAASYAVFANGGNLIKPWGIKEVKDRFGKELWSQKVEKTQVLNPQISYIITNILSDNKARELLFGPHNPLDIGRAAAVKTGTGEDFKNAWTIGYTPSLLALVWVGNNDGSPMKDIWGLESAALIWNRFMTYSLSGTKVEQFDPPSGLQQISVCALDGSKAVSGQPTLKEISLSGEEPTDYGKCGFMKMQQDEQIAKAEAEKQQQLLQLQENQPSEPLPPDQNSPGTGNSLPSDGQDSGPGVGTDKPKQ
ncbi:MAG TPA: transglycosylase domain-containing protein [Candidatus Saccharimonadales bacterium]|nr:transglycosylase domain-containing protein [Candidatus Saccharimonadales bacterium]